MARAYALVQAIKAAGRNPPRASFVKALETTKLSGGPGVAPFGFSSSNHLGYLGVQVVTIAADGTQSTAGAAPFCLSLLPATPAQPRPPPDSAAPRTPDHAGS